MSMIDASTMDQGSIEQQVEKATAPLKRFIARADRLNGSVFWNPLVESYIDGTESESGHHTSRLRVDYELSDDAREEISVANGILEVLVLDLEDLLYNGDVNSDDPLMKVLDGAVKRDVDAPVWIQVSEAVMYSEYKAKKESTEYTLYILLAVRWPNANQSLTQV